MVLCACLGLGRLAEAAPSPLLAVERRIVEGCPEEAVGEVERVLQRTPQDPHALLLGGYVSFLLGDYETAVRRFEEASRFSLGNDEWQGIRELAVATANATKGYVRAEMGHFVFLHPPGKDAVLLPYAAQALEKARAVIGEDLGYLPPEGLRVRVEIVPDVATLARLSTLSEREIQTSGTIAVCKFQKLMLLSPRALARGYPWLDSLVHEYVHYVVSKASKNAVPVWLHEGLAKFEERRWRGEPVGRLSPSLEHLLARALRQNRLIPLQRMHPSLAKLPSQEDAALAFAQLVTLVDFIHRRNGYEGLRRLIEGFRDGLGEQAAVKAATGMSREELIRAWRSHLATLGLKMRPGASEATLEFRRRDGKRSPSEDLQAIQVIKEERARRHARLGGLLRARRRLLAAAVEYRRAQAIVGKEEPIVAQRLARTYLEMGDAAKAIEVAEAALAVHTHMPGLYAVAGEAALRKGEVVTAAARLEEALRLSPFDPAVHCALREVHTRRGEQEAAAQEARFCTLLAAEREGEP